MTRGRVALFQPDDTYVFVGEPPGALAHRRPDGQGAPPAKTVLRSLITAGRRESSAGLQPSASGRGPPTKH